MNLHKVYKQKNRYLKLINKEGTRMKKLSISVFFPAYNDEKTIHKLIVGATEILKPLTDDYEIIVIEDGSPDNVGKIADEIAEKDKHVKVVHHKKNKGYGGALKSGFKAATKDYIFYTDGDAQYDIKELPNLLKYKDYYDIVSGYKRNRGDQFYRMILGKLYSNTARMMFNIKIRDMDCAFKLFKSHIVKDLDVKSDGGFSCVELWHKINRIDYKIKEVPVSHYEREHGESQFFSFSRVFSTLSDFTKGWFKFVIKEKFR